MKYAASMKYGGELIEAHSLGYDAYYHLGLLCPECKDTVYLRRATKRKTKDGVISLPAVFCHFPTKDPTLVSQCELRVSQYDEAELKKRKAKAKNQRSKMFARWFWQVLTETQAIYGLYLINVVNDAKGLVLEDAPLMLVIDLAVSVVREKFLERESNSVYLGAKALVEGKGVFSSADTTTAIIPSGVSQATFYDKFASAIDKRLHAEICKEAFEFLYSKRNEAILRDLLIAASCLALRTIALYKTKGFEKYGIKVKIEDEKIYWIIPEIDTSSVEAIEFGLEGVKRLTEAFLSHILVWVATTPWAYEFDKLQKEETKAA